MVLLLAATAGLISSLSPCVITALPFVVGSALNKNRWGPLFISSGLIASFVGVGLVFAMAAEATAQHQKTVKVAAAAIFVVLGVIMLVPSLSDKFSRLLQRVADKSSGAAAQVDTGSRWGFFFLGVLLGVIWSPCSGPTLGFALALVAKQGQIAYGASIMLVYGLGAALPLVVIAYLSRTLVQRRRSGLQRIYAVGKVVMALLMIAFGLITLTGCDKHMEAFLISHLPDGWLSLITKY